MMTQNTTTPISGNNITHVPAIEVFTENLKISQEIPIPGPYQPKDKYELVPPMETSAETTREQENIDIKTVVYINSSHVITKLNVYERYDPAKPEETHLIIEFKKLLSKPTTEFIPYLVEFKIEDREKLTTAHLYLKSSNPRTSRGTVTTVKRPM